MLHSFCLENVMNSELMEGIEEGKRFIGAYFMSSDGQFVDPDWFVTFGVEQLISDLCAHAGTMVYLHQVVDKDCWTLGQFGGFIVLKIVFIFDSHLVEKI